MVRALNAEERRLLALATAQQAQIADPGVADSWHVLVEAISKGWIGVGGAHSLPSLLTELSAGGGIAVEEVAIEVSHEDPSGETAIVSFLADRFYVPRAELIYELRRLLARLRGEREPAAPRRGAAMEETGAATGSRDGEPAATATADSAAAADPDSVSDPDSDSDSDPDPDSDPDSDPDPDPDPDSRPLAPIVPLTRARPAASSPPSESASSAATELGRALESLAARLRSDEPLIKPGSFLEVIRNAADKARAEKEQRDAEEAAAEPTPGPAAAAAAATAEAGAAIDRLVQQVREIDRGQLASALHSAADWVKSPEGGGAAIDSLLARLETRLKEAFAPKPGEAAKGDAPPRPDPSEAIKKVRDAMARRIAENAARKAREAQAEADAARRSGKPGEPGDDPDGDTDN